MKIGLISTYGAATPPMAYGGESFYWGLAKTLGEMGHEVHLFGCGGSDIPPGGYLYLMKGSANGMICPHIENWLVRNYHDLLMSMDIVHDCSLNHIPAERLKYIYGKENIVNTINGRTYFMPRPPFNVVTGSQYWQAEAKQCGLNTKMVYWGIDCDFYTPGKQDEREDYFLWLSRFHPVKGLGIALDLAEYLGFPLKIAGSLEYADHKIYGAQYLERIKTIPNVEYVTLPMDSTHHIAKRELYRKAKAFLYPVQYPESFGMVVVEAMACGTPVLTFPMGAMPELVTEGAGRVCKDKREMADTIGHMTNGQNMGERIFSFGFFDCQEQAMNFTWQRAAKAYEKLYKDVLNGESW